MPPGDFPSLPVRDARDSLRDMIGDVVTFLAFYLRGDLTSRFIAKIAVTLVISGGVFWDYLGSLQNARGGEKNAS
jgi:hypothetical protein